MNFEFTAEQELLRESVRRFLDASAPISWARQQLDGERGTTDAVWKGLASLGLPGLLVPEAHGGAGLGLLDMGVVLEEMGRAVHPGPFLSSAVGATRLLLAAGGAGDHAAWLPALADGSRVATLAVHEPGARFAWEQPRTRAARTGDGWRVSGVKFPVCDAAAADLLLVVATAGDGLGVFAVEGDAPGLGVSARPTVDGTRKQARVVLRDVPARRLAGGDARAAVQDAADALAISLSVDGVGAASRALELATAYAKQREQFGQPVGAFQAVQHLLVDMLRDLELGRAGAYYALWAADAAPAAERHRAASMAKAFASAAFPRIGADAIQVFGGVGFTWEMDVHLFYKRLLSLRHTWGDEAHHLDALARIAVDPTGT